MPKRKREFWYISEIRPTSGRVDIVVTVIRVQSLKKFFKGDEIHRVAEVLVGDRTGIIVLVVWDDLIDKIRERETYVIRNLRPKIYKNRMRVVCTRDSTIEEAPYRIPIKEINVAPKIR